MSHIFNFTQTLVSGTNFSFVTSTYYSFNFTDSGYTPIDTDFNFGEVFEIFNILKGTSNNFVAIWADINAGLNSGRFYVGSQGAFTTVKDNIVYDYYTETHAGRGNETLDNDDVVDINIGV